MPDTKNGRERKGHNKRAQLDVRLYERELRALEEDDEPALFDVGDESEATAD